jgi:hypothetical protein
MICDKEFVLKNQGVYKPRREDLGGEAIQEVV